MTTTTTPKELPVRQPVTKLSMEDKSQESNTGTTNKTTGSPRAASPGSTKPAASRQLEDIWKKDPASGSPERRRNGNLSSQFTGLCSSVAGFGSDDDVDDGGLGNGESRAGFISRRPSMTAELETRIRQVRLSEGSDPDRNSGPSSPSATSKWGVYGMNWNTQNPLLGERTTPPQEQNQPISPLARFHQSPLDPPAPRQVSPGALSQGYTSSRPRYQPPPPIDQNQRVQRSQSFSVGDHGGFSNYLPGQTGPIAPRNTLFEEPGLSPVGARFKAAGHAGYPASPLARAPIAEEIDEFDAALQSNSKENSPSRYQDRGRSLSTSAASHGYTRQRMGEGEDVIDEALYEEDEDAALQEFEPLSRSRTLPSEHGQMAGLGFSAPRYAGLTTDRERLQQQRGQRQSPRIVEDIPPSRRQDSYTQAAWDETRAHRSPPRSTEYPGMQDTYDPLDTGSIASPGSMHSFPGIRDYTENYFTNDDARRRVATEQFQYYQMQSRTRHPQYQASQGDIPRPFPYHDPEQYTLHFVKFKANRMDVFYLAKEKKLDLKVKDYVIVDGDRGTDLGMVSKVNVTEAEARSLTAQLQREQAAATAANQNGMNANAMEAIAAAASQVQERDVTIPKKYIHRLAVKNEIDGLQNKMQDEAQAKQVCEMKVQQRGLHMDILDVEYQWYISFPSQVTNFQGPKKAVHLLYRSAESRLCGIGQGSVQNLQDQDLVAQFHSLARHKSTCLISVFFPPILATLPAGIS